MTNTFYVKIHDSKDAWAPIEASSEKESAEFFASDRLVMSTIKVDVKDHGVFTVKVELYPDYKAIR